MLQLRAGLVSTHGDFEKAAKLLEQARVTHQSPLLDFSLARVHYLQQQYRSVLNLTGPLLKKLSGSWEVVYLHSLALAQLQKWEEALLVSQPFLNRSESRGFAHRLVGDLYRYQGLETEAQKIYRQGLEDDPEHLYLIEALSGSWMISGNWKQNRELLENALASNERLQGNPSMRLVLLDRLSLTLHQLGEEELTKQALLEYHQLNDPVQRTRMFSLEEQLLFPADLSPAGPEWKFLPAPVTARINGN